MNHKGFAGTGLVRVLTPPSFSESVHAEGKLAGRLSPLSEHIYVKNFFLLEEGEVLAKKKLQVPPLLCVLAGASVASDSL